MGSDAIAPSTRRPGTSRASSGSLTQTVNPHPIGGRDVSRYGRHDAGRLDRRLRRRRLRRRRRPEQRARLRRRHARRTVHLHLVHHLQRSPRPGDRHPAGRQPRRRGLVRRGQLHGRRQCGQGPVIRPRLYALDFDYHGRSETPAQRRRLGDGAGYRDLVDLRGRRLLEVDDLGQRADHVYQYGPEQCPAQRAVLRPGRGAAATEPGGRDVRRRRRHDPGQLDRRLRHPGLRRHRRPEHRAHQRHHHAQRAVHLHLVDHLQRSPRPGDRHPAGHNRVAAAWYASTASRSTSTWPGASHTTSNSTPWTSTITGGARRSSSATPPRGRCWIPRPCPVTRGATT